MLLAATLIVLITRLIRPSLASGPSSAPPSQATKAEIADHYGKLPLNFEANEGQTDAEVKFISHGPGYNLFLTSTGAVLTLRQPRPQADPFKSPTPTEKKPSDQPPGASVLRLKMIGANPHAQARGEEPLPGKINYLIGDDPQKWHINIPTYGKVYYTDVYPNVNLVYYGNRTELEYDFIVAPGGDVQAISFQVEEAERMKLDEAGDLHLAAKQSEVVLRKPVIYQLTDQGERREVKGEYVIKGKEVRFKTEAFDARKPLIIDPVLSYSTMLGAGGNDYANGIAVDSSGSAYITGSTDSSVFPTTPGAFQTSASYSGNAFVSKLDPTGSSLVYSTFLNGSGSSAGEAIAVDSSGNAYVTGNTNSSDFPTVNPVRSSTANFYRSTDSGGHWNNQVIGAPGAALNVLAIDPTAPNTMYAGMGLTGAGGIYKTTDGGNTWAALNTGVTVVNCAALVINPATPTTIYATLTTNNGSLNTSLYKSTDAGSSWVALTNGLSGGVAPALAIDPSSPNTVYVGGSFQGVFKSTNGGASWVNSSSGINYTGTSAIAVDPMNSQIVYLAASGGGVFKTSNGGGSWAQVNTGLTTTYVATLNIDPASTIYAGTSGGGLFKSANGAANWTAVNNGISGSPGYLIVRSVALSSSSPSTLFMGLQDGRIYRTTDGGNNWTKVYETLTRTSFSAMAIRPGSSTMVYAGAYIVSSTLNDYEGFVSKLNADGTGLIYSTYLGGNGDDYANGIAVDSSGNAIVVGQTASSSFPTVNALQPALSGTKDAFVTKFNATGNALLYSTYLGGSGSLDVAYGVAVDSSGSAYVSGWTTSANFPTLNPFQSAIGDTNEGDAFVTKLNSSGAMAYSTFLGGEGRDIGYGIAVNGSGNAYVTGLTTSTTFPLANPIQSTSGGAAGDAFVTKLNSAGSGLIYSTYLGGSDSESARGIAIDAAGNAYVTGFTYSADFPVITGALRTKSPVFKSTDGGDNWSNDNYGLKSSIATSLALDPTKPSTLFAGTRNNLYKSTDGGQLWGPSSNGLVKPSIVTVVVNPTTPSTMYLAARFTDFNYSRGVYKSTNGGSTWTDANNGLNNNDVLCLAIDPVTPSTLYAGVYGTGVYKSTNGGASWSVLGGSSLPFIQTIAIDPITPTTIYAGANSSPGGLFKSTDGGATWQPVNNGVTTTFILSLAIDPHTPSTIYAGANGGLFKSTNGAASWTLINTGFFGRVVIDPITSSTLYATVGGVSGGIIKSTDGGATWTAINSGLPYPFVWSLMVDPITPAKVYAAVEIGPSDDDAFVTKLDPSGTTLLYSTLLGGNRASGDSLNLNDEGNAIAVDAAGNAYVTGSTRSPDFPVTPNAYQPFNRGYTDAFVSKLTMSYYIKGNVLDANNTPVSGASVTLDDGVSLSTVVTESDGAFLFSHLREGGSFTVSAAKPHFTMSPPQSFSNLHSNQTIIFTATPTNAPFYTVNGHITNNGAPLGGVAVTLSGSQQSVTTTDGNGAYSFTLAGGGNYNLTPALLGFAFTPPSRAFNNLSANQTADFIASRQNFVVTSANDHGPGTLRQAMTDANATPGLDTIVFNIPGAGVHTINLSFELPEITDPVVLDATTQPGYAGTPLIEINGAAAANASACFYVSAGGSAIRGFAINRFSSARGIWLNGGSGNVIQANYIGLDATGTLSSRNSEGIIIYNSSNNLIGGTNAAARNVISGNGDDGLDVSGSGNQIQGNYIGTNASGTAAVANGSAGVRISGGNNTVGGTTPGAGNLISGNQNGIQCGSGTVVQGNLIGTDVTGKMAIANSTGISAYGSDILIGGTVAAARNLISGNGFGVSISSPQGRVQGNFIGTDITGTVALANNYGGMTVGDHTLIGGTTPEARNIISGNGYANVLLGYNVGGTDTATVQGNYIGTDVTGKVALGNTNYGVFAYSSNNLIGGTEAGAGNLISGNGVGVQIGGGTSATLIKNLVQGNLIGLDVTGNASLPNQSDGVVLSTASGNTIGGDGAAGNRIAFNLRNGITVTSGTGNQILGNSIFSNGALGIELSPAGVTANDAGDADTGANNLQNFPLLTSATSSGGNTTIQGTLNSTPGTSFRIELFSNASCDASGNGEGQVLLGFKKVNTDGAGNATFSLTVPTTMLVGSSITATATNLTSGDTSEFSPCISANPTAITLAAFNATAFDKGVFIEWRTGLEVRNLGFRLYREQDGKRELLTPALIAGSALKVGADLQSGESYNWWDAAGERTASYWLEDIDLSGESTWHGPFYSQTGIGTAPSRAQSPALAALGGSSPLTETTRLVEPVATALRPLAAQLGAQVTLGGQAALKISVRREGWYRISFAELAAAGFNTASDSRLWQLFVDRQEAPMQVSTTSGKGGDAAAFIEFYGVGLDTPATDTRTYWLTNGQQAGRRIEMAKNSGLPSVATTFMQTVEHRDRTIYFAALRNGEAENFFGAVIAAEPVEQALELRHLDATTAQQATVEVRLQGVTSLSHRVQAMLNGSPLGELTFSDQQQGVLRVEVAASLLREGSNSIQLTSTGGAGDVSLVDRIRISYPHAFTADDDQLTLSVNSGERVTINGFTSAAIRAFDVTDENAPREVVGEISGGKGSYQISVGVVSSGPRRLLVASNARLSRAAALTMNRPSALRTPKHEADLLIVTRRDLFNALQPLVGLRQAQGLKVEMADIEDVFDEFNNGTRSPQAVKDFLAYTQKQWSRAPRYVLLVGDASYDPRDYLGYGSNDIVPTKLVDTDYLETASDDWLCDFDGDGIGDIAIGRLPVRTTAEVTAVVAKLLRYEQAETPASALLVSDRNQGYDFEAASTSLRDLLGGLRIDELRRGQMEGDTAKKMLYAGLTNGERVVNYVGHGSATAWNGELLEASEAEGLTNTSLPVFVMMNCLNGYFADAGNEALGEALVKARNGGAIAAWASSGMTLPEAQAVMNREFYRALLANGQRGAQGLTLGEAARAAKTATTDPNVRRTWTLLGDPSLRLR
jgi:photosystem II stability/assembly factor-like uncharacterized protein